MSTITIGEASWKELLEFLPLGGLYRQGFLPVNRAAFGFTKSLTNAMVALTVGPGAQIANIPATTAQKFVVKTSNSAYLPKCTLVLLGANGSVSTETLTCTAPSGTPAEISTTGDYVDCILIAVDAPNSTHTVSVLNVGSTATYLTVAVDTYFAWAGRFPAGSTPYTAVLMNGEATGGTLLYFLEANGAVAGACCTSPVESTAWLQNGANAFKAMCSTTGKKAHFLMGFAWVSR